jgi:hypothetical protein
MFFLIASLFYILDAISFFLLISPKVVINVHLNFFFLRVCSLHGLYLL